MTALVLLVVVWLVVLVPQSVKARAEQRREFVDSFSSHLEALSRGEQPPEPGPRRRPSPPQRRRRTVAGLLLSMAVTALPAALMPGKLSLIVHLAVDDCFLLYVALLVRCRDARAIATAAGVAEAGPVAAGAGLPEPDTVLTPALVQPVLG
ncbi:MAG: hypothetical protein ABR511_08880 [Acidimicrobiales bacterium]